MSKLSDLTDKQKENFLKIEYDKLIKKKWSWMNEDWCVISKQYKHRTTTTNVENIQDIKSDLEKSLGIIPVFYFLNIYLR
jgi:hypothetical protein